jgi:hypothetical protein
MRDGIKIETQLPRDNSPGVGFALCRTKDDMEKAVANPRIPYEQGWIESLNGGYGSYDPAE